VATRSAQKKAPAKKKATSRAARATALTPNGLPIQGSAGPRVLSDLGITDVELASFIPATASHWLRAVLWCQFEGPTSLDAIEKHLAGRFDVKRSVHKKFPPDGPDEGFDVPALTCTPKGRYVTWCFYGMRGDVYCEDGSWQLEGTFRAMGTEWGSNRAIYERFKAIALPTLGARNIVERTT
jgi:hypothetical protein